MTQMRDITNIKFGKLTALYPTSKRGKKALSTGIVNVHAGMKLMFQQIICFMEIIKAVVVCKKRTGKVFMIDSIL